MMMIDPLMAILLPMLVCRLVPGAAGTVRSVLEIRRRASEDRRARLGRQNCGGGADGGRGNGACTPAPGRRITVQSGACLLRMDGRPQLANELAGRECNQGRSGRLRRQVSVAPSAAAAATAIRLMVDDVICRSQSIKAGTS